METYLSAITFIVAILRKPDLTVEDCLKCLKKVNDKITVAIEDINKSCCPTCSDPMFILGQKKHTLRFLGSVDRQLRNIIASHTDPRQLIHNQEDLLRSVLDELKNLQTHVETLAKSISACKNCKSSPSPYAIPE